ncbi:MAG TPA: apolipoprotein N-acyltransferase, partial [Terriglobales bacterium]|nr:apolipoprotein N-acyltransferase [Terriglobales bacterium]
YYNSAFAIQPGGAITARYDKEHLLPFGEYFPLRTIRLLRRNFERVRSFTPGVSDVPLETRLGRTAVVICFEAVFPELVRRRMEGAEVLVNLSNDAWLGDNAGPRQHALMVAMRAIETRSWVVRATTTGVSAFIDPHGRVVAATEMNVAAVLDRSVVPLQITTLYERTGDLFAYACVAAALLATVTAFRRQLPSASL